MLPFEKNYKEKLSVIDGSFDGHYRCFMGKGKQKNDAAKRFKVHFEDTQKTLMVTKFHTEFLYPCAHVDAFQIALISEALVTIIRLKHLCMNHADCSV